MTLAPERLLRIVLILALAFVAFRVLVPPEDPFHALASSDNDDIMRFLSVRDLLAGQSWFDNTQYRILPPEGLPMHWSRYVDAGIAATIAGAARFMPMDEAARFGLSAWPMLLLALYMLVTALGARRALGPGAAALAVVFILTWPTTADTYFRSARIDHHNVQILLMTGLVLALIRPGAPWRPGLAAGLIAAASLSVGLETVPLIGLAGLILAARALRDPGEDGTRLLGFALALPPACALLFAGQTAPAAWTQPHCDQFSSPTFALVLIGAVASLALVLLMRRVSRAAGIAGFLAILAAGIALAAPLLAPCLDGPYAILPPEIRALIPKIQEVRPAHWFLMNAPGVFFANAAPALGATLSAAAALATRHATGRTRPGELRAAGTLLLFGALPVLGSFVQVRMISLAAPATPMLAGYALAALLAARRETASPLAGLALLAAGCLTLLPPTAYELWHDWRPAAPERRASVNGDCRDPDTIASLDALPRGTILSTSNLGPPIVLLTHHDALAGPYHRRPEALANGIVPFDTDEAGLRAALARTGADYLLLCRDGSYGRSFAATLAAGAAAPGLTPVVGADPALVVLGRTQGPGQQATIR